MRKYFVFVPLVLILAAGLFGCTGNPPHWTPRMPCSLIIFHKPNGSWTRLQDATGTIGYENNHFHILVNSVNTMLIATAGKTFQDDVSIEVDARKIGGSDNNYFGVVCRYQNPDNYYMFLDYQRWPFGNPDEQGRRTLR